MKPSIWRSAADAATALGYTPGSSEWWKYIRHLLQVNNQCKRGNQ